MLSLCIQFSRFCANSGKFYMDQILIAYTAFNTCQGSTPAPPPLLVPHFTYNLPLNLTYPANNTQIDTSYIMLCLKCKFENAAELQKFLLFTYLYAHFCLNKKKNLSSTLCKLIHSDFISTAEILTWQTSCPWKVEGEVISCF